MCIHKTLLPLESQSAFLPVVAVSAMTRNEYIFRNT